MKKIFLLILSMIVVFLGVNSVSANYTYEIVEPSNYTYEENYNYDNGYRIRNYTLLSDNSRNVGRTELYKNGNLVDYIDTVIFAIGEEYDYGNITSGFRYLHSKISNISMAEEKINVNYTIVTTKGEYEYEKTNIFYLGKKEIDDFNLDISVFGEPKHFLTKLNLLKNGEIISSISNYDSLWESTRAAIRGWVWPTISFGTDGCSFLGINNETDKYILNYKCVVKIVVTGSSAGGPGYTSLGDIYPSFSLSKEEYSLCNYSEEYCEQQPIQIPTPTNLKQYIKSLLLEQEDLVVGSKVGKFQSGSGVILEAVIQNDTTNSYNMIFEVYRQGQTIPLYDSSIEITSGTGQVILPYLGEGDFTWKVKTTDNNGNISEVVDYSTNQAWEIDFSIFEGFEPYPYGYSFTNKPTYSKNLDGGIDNTGLFQGKRKKIEGYKWDVFESAFDLSELDSERKLFNTFEMLGLNQEKPGLFNGSCFGLSTSALMYKSYPEYLSKNYTQFYNGVNNDIFGVNDFDTLIENGITYWNDTDNLIFKDIQAIQTSQGSVIFQKEEKKSMDKESIYVLNELKNKNNGFILGFQGLDVKGLFSKHYVIPYKVEGNKIYIWDSNISIDNSGDHYKQYLEILPNGKIYSPHYNDDLKWKTIDEIYIIPIEIMYNNGNKHKPIGLEFKDHIDIIFGGSSDVYLSDENGNISGIKEGNIYKDIPGVSFTRNGNYIPNSDSNDGLINFSVSSDLTGLNINVDGKIDEIYDLYVSTNDYFTKIENIPTKVGDSDSFNITRENISMKLSDKNNSIYSIFSDDFKDNVTGTIYISNSVIEQGLTNYHINWSEVIKDGQSSITKSVDNDLDGEYEKVQEIKPITSNDGRKGEISGFVFKDKNDDGKLDEDDKLLKGYKVALYVEDGDDFLYNKKGKKKNNPKHKYKCYSGLKNPEKHSEKDENNEHEDVNCFVKTNKDGFFTFKNLEDGKYMIELLNNKDKNNKDGFGEVYEINILNGSISTNNNFIITKNEKIK